MAIVNPLIPGRCLEDGHYLALSKGAYLPDLIKTLNKHLKGAF